MIEHDWKNAIMQFCLAILCITFPLYLIRDFVLSQDLISKVLLILVYGIAGCGLYLIVGTSFEKNYREFKRRKTK